MKGKILKDCIEWSSLDDDLPVRERPKYFRNPSEWRKAHNKNHQYIMPCADDFRKINSYIKNKASDSEIKTVFKISQKILDEIKSGLYNPYRDRKHGDIPKIGRLSVEDVIKAKSLIKDGVGDEEIAEIFGVCKKAIFNLRHKKSWSKVGEDND